jgi:hypothetical protein
MLNIMICAGLVLLMVAFTAAGEKGCDWYWKRRKGGTKHG